MQADGCTMKENTEPCPAENGGQRVVGGERACINQFPWLVYVECTRWPKLIILPSDFVTLDVPPGPGLAPAPSSLTTTS